MGVALLVAFVAFLSRPRVEEFKVSQQEGKILFDKFDDPAKADSMEIRRYDETLGTLDEFRVARDKASGAWTLPSHSGYPPMPRRGCGTRPCCWSTCRSWAWLRRYAGDHRLFGVIEPDKDKLKVGDEGRRLAGPLRGPQGAEPGQSDHRQEGQRHRRPTVRPRCPEQDVVYTVKIDPDKLSTKFQDWIEKDLLKMNAWDVENVALKNYTVSLQPPNRVLVDKKFDLTADFKDSEWKLKELKKYQKGEGAVVALTDQEELNKEKLNDLKTAVDELEIADVRRKPKGLGADLKAGADSPKTTKASWIWRNMVSTWCPRPGTRTTSNC